MIDMEEFATMLRGLQVHFAGWQVLMRHSGWDVGSRCAFNTSAGLKELRAAFARVDTNGDGLVDFNEFKAWWASFHAMKRTFAEIDSNNSG